MIVIENNPTEKISLKKPRLRRSDYVVRDVGWVEFGEQ